MDAIYLRQVLNRTQTYPDSLVSTLTFSWSLCHVWEVLSHLPEFMRVREQPGISGPTSVKIGAYWMSDRHLCNLRLLPPRPGLKMPTSTSELFSWIVSTSHSNTVQEARKDLQGEESERFDHGIGRCLDKMIPKSHPGSD